jgi:hypothetical protein
MGEYTAVSAPRQRTTRSDNRIKKPGSAVPAEPGLLF